jgi:hypothetical protein
MSPLCPFMNWELAPNYIAKFVMKAKMCAATTAVKTTTTNGAVMAPKAI